MNGLWPEFGIEQLFDLTELASVLRGARLWLLDQLLVASTLVQVIIVALAWGAARR